MMNRKFRISLILGATMVLGAGLVNAQEPPPPQGDMMIVQSGPGSDFMPPPIGERIELLGFEGMHGGKVVTGAPFSAVAVSESTQTLGDGNHIARKTETNLFRDSQGRFRKEVTLPAIGPLATSGQPQSFVMIDDPVANANYILHADTKTAEQMGMHFGAMKGLASGAIKGKMEYHVQQAIGEGSLKKEDLGAETIAGVTAQGTRVTHTIPAGQIGNEKAITIVSEHWYSADLQMTVMSKRSDPRFGDTTYTLTNIQRSEPAASLFAVPSDYTVTTGKNRMFIRKFNGGPDAPPPPPSDN
jgi:hypothetical protein